jgi:tRNA A37 threonylcarbamoyladenosine synthetase subunit TsaC/SUA5/YrdC
MFIDDPADVSRAAAALASGAVAGTAFGNFYVIVSCPDAATVRRVNLAKGRPADQVGSITTAFGRIPGCYDWAALDPRLDQRRLRALMAHLHGLGPFGFRGPAAAHVPAHLTQVDQGVRTTQVIAPGRACPSNALFEAVVSQYGLGLLYITSANRSRHLTGAEEEPAHWAGAALAADFPDLLLVSHRDEVRARAAYPRFTTTSVTLLSFHAPGGTAARPVLTVDRHGSLPMEDVRDVAAEYGFDVVLGPTARRRLRVREYAEAVAS